MPEIKLADMMGTTPMCKVLDVCQMEVNPKDFSPILKFTATLNAEKLADIYAVGLDNEMYSILGKSTIRQIDDLLANRHPDSTGQ